jgi:hypothetical protein
MPIQAGTSMTTEALANTFEDWLQKDDVFSMDFTDVILLLDSDTRVLSEVPSKGRQTSEKTIKKPLEYGNSSKMFSFEVPNSALDEPLAADPYFCINGNVHQAYRVYDDSQLAFFSSIIQLTDQIFLEQRPTSRIPEPSRLSAKRVSSYKPLRGLHFATKDLIDIAGLKTSLGSRSHYDFVSPSQNTAEVVERLISLSKVLIGKTKNTQFANGEDPQEWIDYACPWNPRGTDIRTPTPAVVVVLLQCHPMTGLILPLGLTPLAAYLVQQQLRESFQSGSRKVAMPQAGLWQVSRFVNPSECRAAD